MVTQPDREPLGEQSVSKPSRGRLRTCGRAGRSVAGVVSTQPFASAHVLAQPACEKGSRPDHGYRGFDTDYSFIAIRLNQLLYLVMQHSTPKIASQTR